MLNQVQHDELRRISGNYNVTLNLIQGLYFLKMKKSYTYILSNKNRTVIYIGVTGDLNKRITEHKNGKGSDFTKKYNLTDLLYFEEFTDINQAISREKQLKNWRKEWKWDLIKDFNPELKDLFFEI
ncbi:GIY-YIG nuclease family protein [Christiangramia echinicola]|uniref:GIY-YIG nuclease family protein n=1 Tax=Christiangramia echinicola TaxID=279359 RepID=UPI0030EDE65C